MAHGLRRSARINAGHNPNPHNLPRSTLSESTTVNNVDQNVLAAVAQSNLMIMQLLSKHYICFEVNCWDSNIQAGKCVTGQFVTAML